MKRIYKDGSIQYTGWEYVHDEPPTTSPELACPPEVFEGGEIEWWYRKDGPAWLWPDGDMERP